MSIVWSLFRSHLGSHTVKVSWVELQPQLQFFIRKKEKIAEELMKQMKHNAKLRRTLEFMRTRNGQTRVDNSFEKLPDQKARE